MRMLPALLALLLAGAAAAGIHYDFNQPYFVQEPGLKCKDHALARGPDGIYHLYFIESLPDGPIHYLDREQWLGHATSPDLRNWTRQDSILPVVPGTWEEGFVWAPEVLEDPQGGGWYLFYTGADTSSVVRQRMGMAYSTNLYDWERDEDNPVYEPVYWTDWQNPLYLMANCRDPELFQVPGDENWYCLNTVRRADGNAALDLAVSSDLHSWAWQDTFMWHSSANLIESAELWQDGNGRWHLFFMVQNYSDVHHLSNESPWGPWWSGAGSLFDGGQAAEVTDFDDRSVFSRHARIELADGDRYFYEFSDLETPHYWQHTPNLVSLRGLREHWSVVFGDAFTDQPTWGDNPAERGSASSNLEGNSYVSSLELHPYPGYPIPGRIRGRDPVGLLQSAPFALTGDRLSLLVGGGNFPDLCFVALVRESDGLLLFRETGADAYGMEPRLWNTETLLGETVFLAVADLAKMDPQGSWAFISVDDIREYQRQGEDPRPPADPLTEAVTLDELLDASGVYPAVRRSSFSELRLLFR